jgi:hypothetical protein
MLEKWVHESPKERRRKYKWKGTDGHDIKRGKF